MKNIKNSNVLITGGAGFVGSNLANTLMVDNKILVIDDLSMGDFKNLDFSENLTTIKGSVTDLSLLKKVFDENDFDYVFHLAAIASVADSVARPIETHKVNFDSTLMILELLRENKKSLKRLVFSSSAAVYGDEPTLPKIESSIIKPLSPYAVDKFASERMAMVYNSLYGIPCSATRFFNVYGPKQNPASPYSGIISIIVDRLINDGELIIFGDGKQSRDFVYVADVIQALTCIATSTESIGEVYNVGTGTQITLNDLISAIEKISGRLIKKKYEPAREGDIRDSVSQIDKLIQIGYKAKFTLTSGLEKYLENEFE
ncbi:MAG TPA: NAD-dependent epimerase/dehydratase family protein [Lactovum miscens]|uniref:NAD-dependent epimerase/dehydratase family protein n=1 Tax=Lactovum miscens TaxID=190387 RepID=UPI002EDA7C67